jgi:hypothetical protein
MFFYIFSTTDLRSPFSTDRNCEKIVKKVKNRVWKYSSTIFTFHLRKNLRKIPPNQRRYCFISNSALIPHAEICGKTAEKVRKKCGIASNDGH